MSGCLLLLMGLAAANHARAQVTSTWNGTTGNWSDATRWDTDPLFPNNGNGGNDYNAAISGGEVTLDQNIVIESLTMSGTRLTGSGDLTLEAASTWTGGFLEGTGQLIIDTTGSLSVTNFALRRELVNNGAFSTTVNNAITYEDSSFQNFGTYTASPSTTQLNRGTGGNNHFNNLGTFIKQGIGTTQFSTLTTGVAFNNSGLVDLQQGTLRLDSGGTHSGDFAIASGAVLSLSDTHNFEVGTAISGAGTFRITGGTTNVNTAVTIGQLENTGGTLTGTGDITINGASSWTGGFLEGTGELIIDPSGSLAVTNFALRRNLINDGVFSTTGISGITYENATFQNNGTYTANPSGSQLSRGTGGTNVFNNVGTFVKQGSGTTQFSTLTTGVAFNNSGLVDIQQGTLRLDAGGTQTGDFSVAQGATLVLSGIHTFEGDSEINGSGELSMGSGTTSFNGTTTVNADFELASSIATVNGSGILTLTGDSTWSSGTMSGSGQTVVAPGATILFNPTAVGAAATIHRSFVNNGTATWAGTRFLNMNANTFQNNGSFTVNSGLATNGTGVFENSGTFTKLGAGGATFGQIEFNNTGSVDIQNGTLTLAEGGTHTGDFMIATGAELSFNDTHVFEGTTNITGSGTFRQSDGTSSVNGTTMVDADFVFNSFVGTINGEGTLTLTGDSTWTSGTMSGSGQTVVAPGATILFNPTEVGAAATIHRSLINNGTATWAGTRFLNMNANTFQNNGSFTVNSSLTTNGTGTFENASTFTKLGTGGASFSQIVFNNAGTVDVQAGTLTLAGGGTHTSNFTVANGATLSLNGTHSFESMANILGGGAVSMSSGTINFNGTNTIDADLSLMTAVSTLAGSGTLTLAGDSVWSGAFISGSGQTTVAATGTLELSGTSLDTNRLSRLLIIDGSALWTGGWIQTTNGTIQNNGTFTDTHTTGEFSSGGGTNAFHNAGAYVKQTGNTTRFFDDTPFNNTGTVDIQGGTLRLHGGGSHSGDFAVAPGTSLILRNAHTFTGINNITGTGTFSNEDTLEIQAGTLNIAPTLTQLSGSDLSASTWRVMNNSTLNISSGANITRNFADVTIDGASSSFSKIDSMVENYGSFAITGGYNHSAPAAFTNGGIITIGSGSKFTATSGVTQTAAGTLLGSGMLSGNLTSSGTIRPGNSPGILEIDGDLTLTSTSLLEIELGGTGPDEFDQVIVSGTAELNGRLEVPILPGYTPNVGDNFEFLSAGVEVTGNFTSVSVIGLEAANSNVAIDLNPVMTGFSVSIEIVAINSDINFAATSAAADWFTPSTWSNGSVPETENMPAINNLAGAPQEVNIASADAFVHELDWQSTVDPLTLKISSAKNLSAIVGASFGDNGILELDTGTVVTPELEVQAGGKLSGNGTVVGKLMLGDGGGTMATLSPGFSVGHLDVEGDYEQQSNGLLVIDVDDSTTFDTFDITGTADLGGTVEVIVTDESLLPPGTMIEVLTAGNLMGTEFDDVITMGASDIALAPVYSRMGMALLSFADGDMDGLGDGVTTADVAAFAMALTDPIVYRATFGKSVTTLGDLDDDGDLDVDDIDDFADAVGMSLAALNDFIRAYSTQVPEPTCLALGIAASLVAFSRLRPFDSLFRKGTTNEH